MRIRRNFKMAAISIVLLITGGILIACGKKEVITTEQTTETITTEATTEVVNNANVEIENYKFSIPDGYEFTSQSDNVYMYSTGDNVLSISVDNVLENFETIDEDRLHNMMTKNWLGDGQELSYQYYEKNRNKACVYTAVYKIDGKDVFLFAYCLVDPVKDKMVSMTYLYSTFKNDEASEKEVNDIQHSFEQFETINF